MLTVTFLKIMFGACTQQLAEFKVAFCSSPAEFIILFQSLSKHLFSETLLQWLCLLKLDPLFWNQSVFLCAIRDLHMWLISLKSLYLMSEYAPNCFQLKQNQYCCVLSCRAPDCVCWTSNCSVSVYPCR